MIKKYILLTLFFVSVLLIIPNFSFGATNVEMQIQSLMAQIQALQLQLIKLQTQQGSDREWCHTFNTNLRIGDVGDEVNALQIALQKEGFSISNDETAKSGGTPMVAYFVPANFGESTASAVTGFQEKYRAEVLTPVGLKYGTGYVGKSTRAKLNKLYGCEITKPPASAGYLEIEPSSASLEVGGSISMQAMYQPPMPKCPEGFACPQVMPARYPIVAEWISSNPSVASVVNEISSCMAIGCPVITAVTVKGNSNGTADIKASYKSPSGVLLTATAKVSVAGSVTGVVSTNTAPKITGIPAIPSSIKPDQSVSFSWNVMDAEGDNLSWSANWGDGTGFASACPSLAPNTNFTAFHSWSRAGTYKVQVSVNDCKGGSDTHAFNVTIGGASGTSTQSSVN